jgi:hypothetical protein
MCQLVGEWRIAKFMSQVVQLKPVVPLIQKLSGCHQTCEPRPLLSNDVNVLINLKLIFKPIHDVKKQTTPITITILVVFPARSDKLFHGRNDASLISRRR